MELHDHLYALGLSVGRDVFDDADGLRGALDDFLDEDAASTGDINLLVDAVRLGAYRSMVTILDSGADVTRAIEEAGSRLARDRGSADTAGAQWACAVLGFAIGRVGDPDVRRYRTPTRPPQSPPAPQPPPFAGGPSAGNAPTYVPPGQAGGGFPPPQAPPPYVPAAPLHVSPPHAVGAFPPPGAHAAGPWQPRQKRKLWPVVVAVVAVLAIVGGIGGYVVATSGDDEPAVQGGSKSPSTSSSTPTTETIDPETGTDFASVNNRYAGLADLVTTGVDGCEADTVRSGETERLSCTFAAGTLELVTYGSGPELGAGRAREVTLEPGGVFEDGRSGTVMGFEEEDDNDVPTSAYLYWDDDDARQSAKYVATPGTDLDDLVTLFRSTGPSLDYPTGPSSQELIDFAEPWFLVGKCVRIETLVANELEESYCDVNGPIEVYLGQFDSKKALNTYRKLALANAKADDRELRTWNQVEGDPPIGALYEYTTDSGSAVRYWDQPSCLCYAEAYLSDGSYERLKNWWFTG